MTPFRFEHEFHGKQSKYWDLFFDEVEIRAQLDSGGMKSYEIEELSREDGVWRRTISATPARDLPAIVRKVTGASLGYTETTIYTVASNSAVTTVIPSTLTKRIDFSGTHTLTETGPGAFSRVFEGQVEVRVAVVGKKIEKLIVADMEKTYATGSLVTQAKLERDE